MGEKRKSLLSNIWTIDIMVIYVNSMSQWRNMSSTTANEWESTTKRLRWWWRVITSTPHALHDLCWAPHDLSQLSTSLIPKKDDYSTYCDTPPNTSQIRSIWSSCYKQAATNWLCRSSGGASCVVRRDLKCRMKDWKPAPWMSFF